MSVSSVGSSSPNPYLQRLLSPDDADPSDAAAPSDPLQALYQAVTGGQSSDPLVAAAASQAAAIRCRRCCQAPWPTAPPPSPPPTPMARRPQRSLTPTAPRSR